MNTTLLAYPRKPNIKVCQAEDNSKEVVGTRKPNMRIIILKPALFSFLFISALALGLGCAGILIFHAPVLGQIIYCCELRNAQANEALGLLFYFL